MTAEVLLNSSLKQFDMEQQVGEIDFVMQQLRQLRQQKSQLASRFTKRRTYRIVRKKKQIAETVIEAQQSQEDPYLTPLKKSLSDDKVGSTATTQPLQPIKQQNNQQDVPLIRLDRYRKRIYYTPRRKIKKVRESEEQHS